MSEKKNYEIREIEADDIDYLTEIIAKMDADDLVSCFDDIGTKSGGKNVEAIGMKVMVKVGLKICKNYRKAKKDIYALLSRLSGLSAEEIAHMPLPDFVGLIMAVFKSPSFADSFKVASSFAE